MQGVYALDNQIFRDIHIGWHNSALDYLFLALSVLGLGGVQAGIALAMLAFRSTKDYVLPLLATVFVSGLPGTHILKQTLPRDRPSRLYFAQPQEEFFSRSFPSGHTTTAFAFAFMLLFITWGTKRAWAGWTAMAIAVGVGLSRIYRGVHWPSDVLAGAFIGLASAALVYIVLDRLGHSLGLDRPEATLTGRETAEAS